MNPSGLLVDIDGVLTVGWQPIDGAVEAFDWLRGQGVPMRLATNTTTRSRLEIADLLHRCGFGVDPDEILTAPAATAAYLRQHLPDARCYLLSEGDIEDDLDGVDIVEPGNEADAVVLGGAGPVYTHAELNRVFKLLLDGASFVAMHRNLYWRTAAGIELDTGAYVSALEAATGMSPVVIGKPARSFFEAAINELGVPPEQVAMVGDDIVNDVLGAQELGMKGVLVKTGKYRDDAVAAAGGSATVTIDSFAHIMQLFA